MGVFDEATPVYGDTVSPDWNGVGHPLSYQFREIFKSFIMTSVLSAFQIFYLLVSGRGAIYSQESYKWAIYNVAIHVQGAPHQSIESALSAVPDVLGSHDRFKKNRSNPDSQVIRQLALPFVITYIHLWGLIVVFRSFFNE